MDHLAVCALIIREDDKVLCVSRKNNPNDFGLPGGKVDPGELPIEALKRELFEETGLIVDNAVEVFNDMDGKYEVITFKCTVKEDKINTTEAGVVAYKNWNDLFAGSFGIYNKKLYHSISIM